MTKPLALFLTFLLLSQTFANPYNYAPNANDDSRFVRPSIEVIEFEEEVVQKPTPQNIPQYQQRAPGQPQPVRVNPTQQPQAARPPQQPQAARPVQQPQAVRPAQPQQARPQPQAARPQAARPVQQPQQARPQPQGARPAQQPQGARPAQPQANRPVQPQAARPVQPQAARPSQPQATRPAQQPQQARPQLQVQPQRQQPVTQQPQPQPVQHPAQPVQQPIQPTQARPAQPQVNQQVNEAPRVPQQHAPINQGPYYQIPVQAREIPQPVYHAPQPTVNQAETYQAQNEQIVYEPVVQQRTQEEVYQAPEVVEVQEVVEPEPVYQNYYENVQPEPEVTEPVYEQNNQYVEEPVQTQQYQYTQEVSEPVQNNYQYTQEQTYYAEPEPEQTQYYQPEPEVVEPVYEQTYYQYEQYNTQPVEDTQYAQQTYEPVQETYYQNTEPEVQQQEVDDTQYTHYQYVDEPVEQQYQPEVAENNYYDNNQYAEEPASQNYYQDEVAAPEPEDQYVEEPASQDYYNYESQQYYQDTQEVDQQETQYADEPVNQDYYAYDNQQYYQEPQENADSANTDYQYTQYDDQAEPNYGNYDPYAQNTNEPVDEYYSQEAQDSQGIIFEPIVEFEEHLVQNNNDQADQETYTQDTPQIDESVHQDYYQSTQDAQENVDQDYNQDTQDDDDDGDYFESQEYQYENDDYQETVDNSYVPQDAYEPVEEIQNQQVYEPVQETQQIQEPVAPKIEVQEPVVPKIQVQETVHKPEVIPPQPKVVQKEEPKVDYERAAAHIKSIEDFTATGNHDSIEKFLLENVLPTYKMIKGGDFYLSLACQAIFGLFVVIFLARLIKNLFTTKKTATGSVTNSAEIASIKEELKVINETLAKSEANTNSLIKEKKKADGVVVEFQNEVMESHKALWGELNSLKKLIVAERSNPTVKIPGKKRIIKEAPSGTFLNGDDSAATTYGTPTISSMLTAQAAAPKQTTNSTFKTTPLKTEVASAAFIKKETDFGFKTPGEAASAIGNEAGKPLSKMFSVAKKGSSELFEDSPLTVVANSVLQKRKVPPSMMRTAFGNVEKPVGPQSDALKVQEVSQ